MVVGPTCQPPPLSSLFLLSSPSPLTLRRPPPSPRASPRAGPRRGCCSLSRRRWPAAELELARPSSHTRRGSRSARRAPPQEEDDDIGAVSMPMVTAPRALLCFLVSLIGDERCCRREVLPMRRDLAASVRGSA
jgi:hypothetical protein